MSDNRDQIADIEKNYERPGTGVLAITLCVREDPHTPGYADNTYTAKDEPGGLGTGDGQIYRQLEVDV